MSIMFACFMCKKMWPLIIWSLSSRGMDYREAFHISWQKMLCDHSEVSKLLLYITLTHRSYLTYISFYYLNDQKLLTYFPRYNNTMSDYHKYSISIRLLASWRLQCLVSAPHRRADMATTSSECKPDEQQTDEGMVTDRSMSRSDR